MGIEKNEQDGAREGSMPCQARATRMESSTGNGPVRSGEAGEVEVKIEQARGERGGAAGGRAAVEPDDDAAGRARPYVWLWDHRQGMSRAVAPYGHGSTLRFDADSGEGRPRQIAQIAATLSNVPVIPHRSPTTSPTATGPTRWAPGCSIVSGLGDRG